MKIINYSHMVEIEPVKRQTAELEFGLDTIIRSRQARFTSKILTGGGILIAMHLTIIIAGKQKSHFSNGMSALEEDTKRDGLSVTAAYFRCLSSQRSLAASGQIRTDSKFSRDAKNAQMGIASDLPLRTSSLSRAGWSTRTIGFGGSTTNEKLTKVRPGG